MNIEEFDKFMHIEYSVLVKQGHEWLNEMPRKSLSTDMKRNV